MKMTDQLQRIIDLDLGPVVGGCKLHLVVDGPSVRWYWGGDDDEEGSNHDPPLWLHHDIALPVYEKFLADELIKAGCKIVRQMHTARGVIFTRVSADGFSCQNKDHLLIRYSQRQHDANYHHLLFYPNNQHNHLF